MTLELNGTDEAIDCGTLAVLENLALKTVMAWVNVDVTGDQIVMSKRGSSTGWRLQVETGGTELRMMLQQLFSTSNGQWKSANNTITRDTWHHVAAVYDRGDVANDPVFYIDGISVGVTEQTTPVGTAGDNSGVIHYIGRKATGSAIRFNGSLDDLCIYNRLLSSAEIATIFAGEGINPNKNGLVARWFPGELAPGATVLSVKDISGNGNDGTPEGTPVYTDGILRSRRRVA